MNPKLLEALKEYIEAKISYELAHVNDHPSVERRKVAEGAWDKVLEINKEPDWYVRS